LSTQTRHQEADIVSMMLNEVRETLGTSFTPETELAVEAKLRHMWGGQEVYIPKVKRDVDVQARAEDIRRRYNMCNRRELQAEYGISRTNFYRILKGS